MSRRKTTADRQKKHLLSKARRRREELEHLQTFGIPKRLGTPANLMKVSIQKKKAAEYEAAYKKIVGQAKLLAIFQEDFQYYGLGARSNEELKKFRAELEQRLSVYLGKNEPDTVLDTCTFDYLQEVVDAGIFGTTELKPGSFPKVRKFESGRIQVMRSGEPDHDFLVEKLRAIAR